MKRSENLLLFAESDHNADMLYATGMFVPDPFAYLRLRGRDYLVMSDLEIDRARRQAAHCTVISLSRIQGQLRKKGLKRPQIADILAAVLRPKRIQRLVVPETFPLALVLELKRRRIAVRPRKGMFFPERETKSATEVQKITAALRMAETGMAEAIRALKAARIGSGRRLFYGGSPLTSERLRAMIDGAILQVGGLASHTIVAGGDQGCDPHEEGHGPLRAHEPIILDIFPRSQRTGYFGDLTRTVVRGRASDAVRRQYATVLEGQQVALSKMRAGVATVAVHKAVQELFEKQGYKTGRHRGRMQGFFHGTGHGLGLEIHEPPRAGQNSLGKLKAGHVITVEPGLYYPGVGGVRLEDVAVITEGRPRNLTKIGKELEI